MKKPGKLVYYTTKEGKTQYGRTYNYEELMNGKLIIHLLNDELEHVTDSNGQNLKVLVEINKVNMKGFID